MRTAKIAVSIPRKTFVELEKRRRELKKSRSALVAQALEAWFRGPGVTEEERRYIAGYLAHPEPAGEAAAMAAASAWDEWE